MYGQAPQAPQLQASGTWNGQQFNNAAEYRALLAGAGAQTAATPGPNSDPMGGAFSQNEGIGAGMTPAQIAAYGDPEARPVQTQPSPGVYGGAMGPGQYQALQAQQQAAQQQPPPQLTPAQVFANSQRAGVAGGGSQFDAAGNLITAIRPWGGY
jgi:hypothetical protein